MSSEKLKTVEANKRYCAVCRNFGGMIVDGKKLSMHRFPSSSKQISVRKIWIKRCMLARADFKFNSYDSTRICGQHFIGGKGPTAKNNLPSIFYAKVYRISHYDVSNDSEESFQELIINQENVESSLNIADQENYVEITACSSTEANHAAFNANISSLDVSLNFHDYSDKVPEQCNFRHQSQQTACFKVDASTQTDFHKFKFMTNSTQTVVTQKCDIGIQVDKPCLTYEDLQNNDEKLMFYTGFPSSTIFEAVFDEIKEDAPKQTGRKTNETGRPKSLRMIDEFLLVLMRLRLGLLLDDLADRFKIGTSTCSGIFNRWIDYLDVQFSFLVSWPSRVNVNATMPSTFQAKFPKCRVIIDCTEIKTETPSSLQLRSVLYSDYKSHMTYKSLVGISPAGVVTFVSDLYAGSVSDKQITSLCGIVDICEVGDAIMADKGFLISDITTPKGIELIIPPFKNKKKQLSKREVKQTQEIANLRIHVERQMERIKNFRILQGIMPITMASHFTKIWKICTRLTNLQPQLVTK